MNITQWEGGGGKTAHCTDRGTNPHSFKKHKFNIQKARRTHQTKNKTNFTKLLVTWHKHKQWSHKMQDSRYLLLLQTTKKRSFSRNLCTAEFHNQSRKKKLRKKNHVHWKHQKKTAVQGKAPKKHIHGKSIERIKQTRKMDSLTYSLIKKEFQNLLSFKKKIHQTRKNN